MKLEEEIRSSKPLEAHQRAMLNILFTASQLDCQMNRLMRPYGLTGPQYNILRILNGSDPKALSVLDIQSRMLDRSSNVSRLVEKLRESGFVERTASREDRRMVEINITDEGKKLLEDIRNEVFAAPGTFLGSQLCEGELNQLADLLDRFRD